MQNVTLYISNTQKTGRADVSILLCNYSFPR